MGKAEDKMQHMLQMQTDLNSKIDSDWKTKNNDWNLAVMVEAVEAIDHLNWKWWSEKNANMSQLHLELVDVWHFLLSRAIEKQESSILFNTARYVELEYNQDTLLTSLRNLVIEAGTYKSLEMYRAFANCMYKARMDFDLLYRLYIGKNVLNTFRQENGYKHGAYKKVWNGVEDNEVLYEIIRSMDSSCDGNLKETIIINLTSLYDELQED